MHESTSAKLFELSRLFSFIRLFRYSAIFIFIYVWIILVIFVVGELDEAAIITWRHSFQAFVIWAHT